ncbi:DUF4240 domain-containing protein [Pedobacter caeni]|uniref:DUF4240 domain-containing protein n=1 Tax=Pedobacter caeni TaxID=288992 RepID=A0A1M5NPY5_9SPHI|nr:DUF4240 domain-containing protein [Pedobacter caeni]SHG91616.1 Protein of unknown function [Pedobacter caeni]
MVNDDKNSDWFWDIILRAGQSRPKLKAILSAFSKEELLKFQEEFVEASVELQDDPYLEFMEESEDGVEDIANWVVSKGKSYYDHILQHPNEVPNSVNDYTDEILHGVADEVCYEVFGESTGIY